MDPALFFENCLHERQNGDEAITSNEGGSGNGYSNVGYRLGKECVSGSRRRREGQDGSSASASAPTIVAIHGAAPTVSGGDGGLRRGAPLSSRKIAKLGHEVKLVSPRFVRSYVKSNKNDAKDAEAICEAVGRPSM